MIKKSIACMLAMVMVMFSFTVGAIAAPADCYECEKCDPLNVRCPEEGQVASQTCPFDYDEPWNTPGAFCSTVGDADYDCKVLLDICSCPNACKIVAGNNLGIVMEIITPGVYFAEDTAALNLKLFSHEDVQENEDACRDTTFADFDDSTPPAAILRQFTGIEFFDGNLDESRFPIDACTSDGLTTLQEAKTLMTMPVMGVDGAGNPIITAETGYELTLNDTRNNLCLMWVDVPELIINQDEYQESWAGDPIEIKIGVFTDWDWIPERDLLLCPTCIQDLCECTITVGYFCCDEEEVAAASMSMLFPYFTPDNDTARWWSSMALTNLSDAEGTATVRIYENDGDMGMATVTVPANTVDTSRLHNISFVIDPGSTGSGVLFDTHSYVQVCTDFAADGFAMIGDNSDMGLSMSYLPRTRMGNMCD